MRVLTAQELSHVSGGENEVEAVIVTARRNEAESFWAKVKDFLGFDGQFGYQGAGDGHVTVGGAGVVVAVPIDEDGDVKITMGAEFDIDPTDGIKIGPIGGVGYEASLDDGWSLGVGGITYTFNYSDWLNGLNSDGLGLHQYDGQLYFGPAPGTPGGPNHDTSPGDGENEHENGLIGTTQKESSTSTSQLEAA